MTKHIEFIVSRPPVRDADRVPLVPVRELAGLTRDERTFELRLRVRSGAYSRPTVVEQVARAIVDSTGTR